MNYEEFLHPRTMPNEEVVKEETIEETFTAEPEELDIQKVVVEELAADKAKQDEEIALLKTRVDELQRELDAANVAVSALKGELDAANNEVFSLKGEISTTNATATALKVACEKVKGELAAQMAKEMDLQERNPNALALLDRDIDLPDRFPGETRDHVLEAVREARDRAEVEGRIRRAQVLEGVLVANEPNGNLAQKRAALEKFFNDKGNILSGEVIAELERCGISHKKGDEYLLPSEILLRTY